jgi:hypothetical protein
MRDFAETAQVLSFGASVVKGPVHPVPTFRAPSTIRGNAIAPDDPSIKAAIRKERSMTNLEGCTVSDGATVVAGATARETAVRR